MHTQWTNARFRRLPACYRTRFLKGASACHVRAIRIRKLHAQDRQRSSREPQTAPPSAAGMAAPTAQRLRDFGLEVGDRARARDTDCSICGDRVRGPVVTKCSHIYCFECINRWFESSTQCPICRAECRTNSYETSTRLYGGLSAAPARVASSQWIRATDSRSYVSARNRDALDEVWGLGELHQFSIAPLTFERSEGDLAASRSDVMTYAGPSIAPPQIQSSEANPSRASMGAEDVAGTASMMAESGNRDTHSIKERHVPALTPNLVRVDAERMLDIMWATSRALANRNEVPLRCRAIAKCVWREWRDFLRGQDGRLLPATELLAALLRSFHSAAVDYGWVQDWRDLPEGFLQILNRSARRGVDGLAIA